MSNVRILEVDQDDDGLRLDRWFKKHFPKLTHGRLQKMLRTGQIRLDGGRAKAGSRVAEGQAVRVPPIDASTMGPKTKNHINSDWSKQDMEIINDLHKRIIYQDDDVLILNKPAGLAVQGGSKTHIHVDGYLSELRFEAKESPRLVHRLDKDTSGVLVLARNALSARWLTEKFRGREVRKLYWALVAGVPEIRSGIIDMRLAKQGGRGGEKMTATEAGKIAQTVYRTVDHAGRHTALLAVEPLTGRTHQIRAHAALALKTTVIGDGKYGGAEAFPDGVPETDRLQLHARSILLPSRTGAPILAEAEPSESMTRICKFFGFDPETDAVEFLEE